MDNGITFSNSLDIFSYGSGNQEKIAELSKTTLDFVSKIELNQTSSLMENILSVIINYNFSSIDKPIYKKILNLSTSNADIIKSYKKIKNKIVDLSTNLELEYNNLIKMIVYYDKFYEKYLTEYKILEENIIFLETFIKTHNHPLREDLEKRLLDLKLTKQMTAQKIVNIKIVHENNKTLMERIHLLINITLPLWQDTLYKIITIKQYQSYESLFGSDELTSIITDIKNITLNSVETIKQIDTAKEEIKK